jgi:hypothetical protein
MAQRSLKNLRRDTLRELLTHLIHQTSARVTFGYLGLEAEDEGASFSE